MPSNGQTAVWVVRPYSEGPLKVRVTDEQTRKNTSTVKEGGFGVALPIGCLIILGISAAILHLQNCMKKPCIIAAALAFLALDQNSWRGGD